MKGKPSVKNHWLLILSGIMWSGVGVLLNSFALKWLAQYQQYQAIIAEVVGVLLGIAIAVFGALFFTIAGMYAIWFFWATADKDRSKN